MEFFEDITMILVSTLPVFIILFILFKIISKTESWKKSSNFIKFLFFPVFWLLLVYGWAYLYTFLTQGTIGGDAGWMVFGMLLLNIYGFPVLIVVFFLLKGIFSLIKGITE